MSVMSKDSADVGDPSIRKKRSRKRKSRSRTDANDEASEHEEEDEPLEKSTKTASTEESGEVLQIAGNGTAQNDRSDPADISIKLKEKRKRKRTRNKGKKEGDTSIEESGSKMETQAKSSPAMQEYLESLVDPHDQDGSLCEKTINALAYARQYHLARTEWKFNKAKQEYLIRHMLTPPPILSQSANDNSIVPKDDERKDEAKEEDKEDSSAILDQQHWPDEWNKCVAKYLTTIQGKAKERLLHILTRSAKQVIPAMPTQEDAAIQSTTTPFLNAAPFEKKSVSFGDLAMSQDASSNKISDSSINISVAEIQRRQFQKDRAAKLLDEMQN